uniref:Mitochondrial folate transporter/carrier n=1 Tax=Schistocephalus solidus TaxID=70667 RepID=A0A0X3PTF1_SCHSO
MLAFSVLFFHERPFSTFLIYSYGAIKNHAQEGDPSRKLRKVEYLGYAYLSGCLVLSVTNPLWVVKTRMCLQYETLGKPRVPPLTTWGNLVLIWRLEGMKGMYRGMVPGVIGVSNGAIQFLLYEEMRNFYNGTYFQRRIDTHLSSVEYLTIAILSKAVAVATTCPYQVVRSRLQDQHRRYAGLMDVINTVWRYEGLFGFYKGLVPSIIRTAPACGITFLVYENLNKWLKPNSR